MRKPWGENRRSPLAAFWREGEGWYNEGAMVGKLFAKIHNHKNRVQNRGFTLIELLVVVAIIALLSEIVLASLQTAMAKARNAKRVEMVKQYQNALELYFVDKGSYPLSGEPRCLGLGDAETCIAVRSYKGSNALKTALEPYIPGVPALREPVSFSGFDMSGLAYQYPASATSSSYQLKWIGEGKDPFCGSGKKTETWGVNVGCVVSF
jgi:prepilin-type N-terminal cleavage/methylation domain-containing protein